VTQTLVLADPALSVAERLCAAASSGAQIALAGGSTPRSAYELAASMGADWSGCRLWFGDERCVSPNDERSNYRMVKRGLLDRLAGPVPKVHRIRAELGPQRAAEEYERELRETVGGEDPPRLDLVLLGLGPDGHCASLFPEHPSLDERRRLALPVERPGLAPWVPRVTLTLTMINAAREVVFLVVGADKADAVARAIGGIADPRTPASMVAPFSGRICWFLDEAAAGQPLVRASQ
jgi:6-phosphogluconolactonase